MERFFELDGAQVLGPSLPLAIASIFVLAIAAPWVNRFAGRSAGWLLAILPFCLTAYFASFTGAVASGETFQSELIWVPTLGVNLSCSLDGLSLLFALLINGVGGLVLIYAGGYLEGHPLLGRFYSFLLMFMASMLGLVLSANLLGLFVFWELTSLSSYLLIGFDQSRPQARASALQALLVTGGGGLALMAGLLLLGSAGGSFEIALLQSQAEHLRSHALYVPAVLLILAGAFTKSAQFPFHFWLPAAMEAPTPVSAYLHSATMVKAGIYLIARLSPALGGTDLWIGTVSTVGVCTMLLGAWLALLQTDLKRLLAYSTISSLGTLTFLLGLGGELATQAAIAFLLGHALYKGALFLVAGSIDHSTGTRDVRVLTGLGKVMPITAIAAGLASLSMAGLPPLFGFIAKELSYEVTLHSSAVLITTAAAVTANAFLVAVAIVVGLRPFWGSRNPDLQEAHEVTTPLWLGPVILASLGLVFGVFPQFIADPLVGAASAAVLGRDLSSHLTLWHGFTTALGLSLITLSAGIASFAIRGWLVKAAARWGGIFQWGPTRWYDWALTALNAVALGMTRVLQSGYLRHYLMITLGTMFALASYSLLRHGALTITFDWSDIRFYEAGLAALILFAVFAVIMVKSRLSAIMALGVVGYGVALVFIMYGAPDLAMTQFLVETLTVILFVLVFFHLPESTIVSGSVSRVRDMIISVGVGGVMTFFVLLSTPDSQKALSDYFVTNSKSGGHGQNIVNVILVDFRGLDTMGEITVLTIAAVGVYALLKLRRRSELVETGSTGETIGLVTSAQLAIKEEPTAESQMSSMILCTATRFLLPLLLLFSFFLLMRGHNEPGGGFTGGLVAAAAFVLYRFAFGVAEVNRVLPFDPRVLMGAGLLVALCSGVLALFAGQPLMTGLWNELHIPGVGEVPLGTPLIFDVGVYMAVMGVTLSIILPLAEE